jgi:hypothetical protein
MENQTGGLAELRATRRIALEIITPRKIASYAERQWRRVNSKIA